MITDKSDKQTVSSSLFSRKAAKLIVSPSIDTKMVSTCTIHPTTIATYLCSQAATIWGHLNVVSTLKIFFLRSNNHVQKVLSLITDISFVCSRFTLTDLSDNMGQKSCRNN